MLTNSLDATVGYVSEQEFNGDAKVQPSGTAMRAQTAAKKLGIYLPATPQEFQDSGITHEQLRALHTNPPEWLENLRREGPHPRQVVAQKLGISVAALKKNDLDKPLTTAEIKGLLDNQPAWLREARTAHAQQREESASTSDASQATNDSEE
ncbi:MAG: DUF5997 family protein [Corynebacterium sp.]|nr:DUF5997 family protein [Corynebacterium sp.]